MMRETLSYRQGDVLLVQSALPAGRRHPAARNSDGTLVLAAGEATGHHHVIAEPEAELLEFADGSRYLRVSAPVMLRHEEHQPIPLSTGIFKVVIQREYVPGPVQYREVAD